jgi:hypothetical protein
MLIMRWALILVLLSFGCVHVNSSVLNSAYSADPVPAEDVAVFLGEDIVPEDCERVAIVHAAGSDQVMNALREEAGRLGADAIDLRALHSGTEVRKASGDHWDALALRCSA